MSYLDLVEEYPKDYKTTLFEKIIMASRRAKNLARGKAPLIDSIHRETYMAIEEIREGYIGLVYRDDDETKALEAETEESEEKE